MALYDIAILFVLTEIIVTDKSVNQKLLATYYLHDIAGSKCLKLFWMLDKAQDIAGAFMNFYKKINRTFLMTNISLEPLRVVFFHGLQRLKYY